ncbi:transglycosylase domain-containing protein [Rhodoferax sp.]|uniref:transglycosylase domain-containing protein n=1 Tax=Rhodoferax sp. TaxID=50421 RepID=UPI00261FF78C|nr:transglycosylase domain-containing protein [Rhodoferax sp.]MDD2926776.1 transglycosylase domain-containing protein [Rhodoferax sp.]
MKAFGRWLVLVLVAGVLLQLFFVARIATMLVVDPQSTTFERSEAWRVLTEKGQLRWRQQWTPYSQISDKLKRAVIASEDDGFVNHDGVDWTALEKAWQKNAKAEEQAAKAQARLASKPAAKSPGGKPAGTTARPAKPPKVVGGSTITQQLAKNLFLSGERTLLRKGQEFVLTLMLEALLDKQRILEIYLNSVEWGEGIFGAEAAAQHYFRKPAAQLSSYEAARLAVMLPRPKYFEKLPNSSYVAGRAAIIANRLENAELP